MQENPVEFYGFEGIVEAWAMLSEGVKKCVLQMLVDIFFLEKAIPLPIYGYLPDDMIGIADLVFPDIDSIPEFTA